MIASRLVLYVSASVDRFSPFTTLCIMNNCPRPMGTSRECGNGVCMDVVEAVCDGETGAVFVSWMFEVGAVSVRVGKGDTVAVIAGNAVSVFDMIIIESVAINTAVDVGRDEKFAIAVSVWVEFILIRFEGEFPGCFAFASTKNNNAAAAAIPARINPAHSNRLPIFMLPAFSL